MAATICFNHNAAAWRLNVDCDGAACETRPACDECKALHNRGTALEKSKEFRQWMVVLRNDREAVLVFADWLEEHDWPELAEQARLTTFIRCDPCGWRRRYSQVTMGGKRMMPFCPFCLGSGFAPYTSPRWGTL